MAIELGLANKSGSWFTYGDQRIGQGRENAKQYLEEHPETMVEMEARIREIAVGPVESLPATLEADAAGELAMAV